MSRRGDRSGPPSPSQGGLAQRAIPAIAFLLLSLVTPPAEAHDRTPRPTPLDYYVHGFDPEANFDAATREHRFAMDLREPGPGEQPDPDTDLNVAGDPEAVYVFTAAEPMASDARLSQQIPGRFLVWIRAWQGESPAPTSAPGTKITFALRTTSGTLVGNGSLTKDVAGPDPVAYEVAFIPKVDALPAGSVLRWFVNITGTNPPGYLPVAAPYGVSQTYPFTVRIVTEVIPPPVPAIRLSLPEGPLEIPPGPGGNFSITVHNDADESDEATLSLQDLPSGASGEFQNLDRQAAHRVPLAGGSNVSLFLHLAGFAPGSEYNLNLRVTSQLGANDVHLLQVRVTVPTPIEPKSGTPALDPALVLATLAVAAWRRPRAPQD